MDIFVYELLDWIDVIHWDCLSINPNAISLLEKNQNKIDWDYLSYNPSPNAISLMEQNQDKICWSVLSKNPNAISLLEQNQDKIHWSALSKNPNAISLLEQNQDKIDWYYLSENPSIFKKKINYRLLDERMSIIKEELIAASMHPIRLIRYLELGGDMDDF